ncbi:hypothetical protein ACTMTF_29690 [Nonomuraea sp. ZG12]|uniref:hypothetical protein n=1 Tax=Nonomuraea sp. ZG12 TaxID=3452207 RepID=UPI003F8C799A
MYRKGLILAGIVGGMVMFGGSALAAMPTTAHAETASYGDPDDHRILICGDDAIWTLGDVHVNRSKNGLVIDVDDTLNNLLGLGSSFSKDKKCVSN